MDLGKYAGYSTADFLNDDDFIAVLSAKDEKAEVFLTAVKAQHPEIIPALDAAVLFLQAVKNQSVYNSAGLEKAVWHRIEKTIAQNELGKTQKVFQLRRFIQWAALFAVVFSAGLFGLYHLGSKEVSTQKGQVLTLTLPDASQVTLNGNSSIRYRRAWSDNSIREVWIKGEALFKVKHINQNAASIKPGERFIVHSNNLNVEVLGTTFNVLDRNGKTDVALLSGKIKVDYLEMNHAESLIMRPGETLRYQANKPLIRRRSINPIYITAWARRQLLFNDASLGDIIETLENSYGYKVYLADSSLRNARIEGTINVPDVEQLMETVSSALHLHIQQSKNTIEITHN